MPLLIGPYFQAIILKLTKWACSSSTYKQACKIKFNAILLEGDYTAKELLASAGYPEGKGFLTIFFAAGKGNISLRVALEIQKQLEKETCRL